MRILEVHAVYPSPIVGERNQQTLATSTRQYTLGADGVQSIEPSDPGYVIVRGTGCTVEVPYAWRRLGESPAVVPEAQADIVATWAEERAKAKRGKR